MLDERDVGRSQRSRYRKIAHERSPLHATMQSLYDVLPRHPKHGRVGHIHPSVGGAFTEPDPARLRVLATGINSYVTDLKKKTEPAWFESWARERSHRFFSKVAQQSSVLSDGLKGSRDFGQCGYRGSPGDSSELYVTNAVKRYLPEKEGLKAVDVGENWFEEGARVWRAELEYLHRANALPHVVIVFGAAWWGHAWKSFGGPDRPSWVADYQPLERANDLFHHLNQVIVKEGDRERPMLLVRLRHPAARSESVSAESLVEHQAFREMVGAA